MARTQAPDYEARRAEIVDQAAKLFAARGFPGASVAELAKACGMSKSLIYHYYPSSRDILFAVMSSHIEALLAAITAIAADPAPPRDQFRSLVHAMLGLYAGAADRQTVLLNDLDQLSPQDRATIVAQQRAIVDGAETILVRVRPDLADRPSRRATTMLFFGMINWLHTWYDPAGRLTPDAIADLAANLALHGLVGAEV